MWGIHTGCSDRSLHLSWGCGLGIESVIKDPQCFFKFFGLGSVLMVLVHMLIIKHMLNDQRVWNCWFISCLTVRVSMWYAFSVCTLKNKGSKMGFSQRWQRRIIFDSLKNLSVNSSWKNQFLISVKSIFKKSKEPFSTIKNLLCNEKFLWMLKVLIMPIKNLYF